MKPFFLYLPFTAPHWPLHALPEDIRLFEKSYLEGWESIREKRFLGLKDKKILDTSACLTSPYFANPLLTPSWDTLSMEDKIVWDRRMAVYAAQIYRMDLEIGRIMEELRREKTIENTLIMFLSDNGATQAAIYLAASWYADRSGPIGTAASFDAYGAGWANASNTPFKLFKYWTAEGGIATPFIAFWPGKIEPGINLDRYGHVIDLLPTCLDAAGFSPQNPNNHAESSGIEGISLLPLFRGADLPSERNLFWEHHGNWAVRDGPWKLLFTLQVNRTYVEPLELFDLSADRSECFDLSADYPEKVNELKALYLEWAEKVGVEPWDSLILAREL
jgi:arylsulfatase